MISKSILLAWMKKTWKRYENHYKKLSSVYACFLSYMRSQHAHIRNLFRICVLFRICASWLPYTCAPFRICEANMRIYGREYGLFVLSVLSSVYARALMRILPSVLYMRIYEREYELSILSSIYARALMHILPSVLYMRIYGRERPYMHMLSTVYAHLRKAKCAYTEAFFHICTHIYGRRNAHIRKLSSIYARTLPYMRMLASVYAHLRKAECA